MGVVSAPVLAGCLGGGADNSSNSATVLEVPFGLDCGGEHLNEAPVIDGLEFHPTSNTRTDIELSSANAEVPENARWWGETLNFEPIPVAYNAHPNEGAQDETLPTYEEIQGTEHDTLYQTAYWGPGEFEMQFSLENGTYEVILHFAEVFFTTEQERVFDVIVNDQVVEEDLDIYAEVGEGTALTISTEVDVTENLLTVTGDSSSNNPQFSGIEIR